MKTTRIIAAVAGLLTLLYATTSLAVRNIPRTNDLLFANLTSVFPSNDYIYTWNCYYPSGSSLPANNSPRVTGINNQKWVKFLYDNNTFYNVNKPPDKNQVPCSGASIVTIIKPIRYADPGGNWKSIVDIKYSELVLAFENSSGRVGVRRKGTMTWAPANTAITNGAMTVLSFVVQTNNSYQVWANGVQIMTQAYDAAYAPMTNLYTGLNNSAIGRNAYDGWSAYNGYIGDVFVYTNLLTTAERQQLEADLVTNFMFAARTITTVISNITPSSVDVYGRLLTEGIGPTNETAVYVCYGPSPGGGDDVNTWSNQVLVASPASVGGLSKNLTNLTGGAYVYSFYQDIPRNWPVEACEA